MGEEIEAEEKRKKAGKKKWEGKEGGGRGEKREWGQTKTKVEEKRGGWKCYRVVDPISSSLPV